MAREYKDSGIEWIGEIPKEWTLKRFQSQVIEIKEKNSPIKTNFILSLTINDGVIPYEDKGNVGNISKDNHEEYKLAYPDTIVLNSMNILIGAVGICKYYGCVSPVYYVFKNVESSDLRFLNYILSSPPFQKYLRKFANGILEIRLRISSSDIIKQSIPVPSLAEQQKIADYLDKVCGEVDELVTLQEQMIEELKAYKQSVITEAVTKGLNPNAPMKDSGVDWIGEIPEHWDLARVGLFYFVTKLAGFEYTDTLMNKISSSEVVPIVRAQNVRMYRFEKESITEFIDLETSLLLDRCSLNKKSLLMTFIGAGIGDVCIFDEPKRYHLAPNVAKIEKNSDFDDIICDEYIMYYLGSDAGKGEINKISKASAQASLSMSTIRKISVAIPPIDEQRAIASYLDTKCSEIDALIAIKQQKIEELKDYKKSVIYEYVTGKKEVGG